MYNVGLLIVFFYLSCLARSMNYVVIEMMGQQTRQVYLRMQTGRIFVMDFELPLTPIPT